MAEKSKEQKENQTSMMRLVLNVPRCSIGMCRPSASFQRSASPDNPGTQWACQRYSVVSRPYQEDTGHTLGHPMSQGHCTGIWVVRPAAGKPRKERL